MKYISLLRTSNYLKFEKIMNHKNYPIKVKERLKCFNTAKMKVVGKFFKINFEKSIDSFILQFTC